MFTSSWKDRLKAKVDEIVFSKAQEKLSPDIIKKYNEIKDILKELSASVGRKIPKKLTVSLCRKSLQFYTSCQELLRILIFECFRDNFMIHLEHKSRIFIITNKIFKMMMVFDTLKLRSCELFSQYSEMRLLGKSMVKEIDEIEDNKFSMLFMISMPMARMFLTMFSSPIFDLEISCLLGKLPKIHLDIDLQKRLGLFTYLSMKYKLRYSAVFFSVLFERATGNDSLDANEELTGSLMVYINMMKRQK